MRTEIGCSAWQLECGDEFSYDEGRTWVRVETIIEDEHIGVEDVIINVRNDNNESTTIHLESCRHVLLNRYWKTA